MEMDLNKEPASKEEYKKWVRAREKAGMQSALGASADKDKAKSGVSKAKIKASNKMDYKEAERYRADEKKKK